MLAMLQATEKAQFVGLEWDSEALDYARQRVNTYKNRCQMMRGNFKNLSHTLKQLHIEKLEGILFDLGVSYHQLTSAQRGFSYKHDGELLMNMAQENPTLIEKLRDATKPELMSVLKEYGDVRNFKRIGTALFEKRRMLETTSELRSLIENLTPRRYWKKTLPTVFQALRIWVNDELENLKTALIAALQVLNKNGRIVVISYHSGEDRIVKTMFREQVKKGLLRVLHKKIIRPSPEEVMQNPQARSAKLRAGEKCVLS
jgi:16S rRNA (cytosine1402-N4)-methyltransferase